MTRYYENLSDTALFAAEVAVVALVAQATNDQLPATAQMYRDHLAEIRREVALREQPKQPVIRHTRFSGLGYQNQGRSNWRFVDLSDCPAAIGAAYASKDELLADLLRFATDRGYAA